MFAFFRSERTIELDASLGDVHCNIVDLEAEIGAELEDCVLRLKDDLIEAADVFADLDCLLAMFGFALENNHNRPTLFASKGIHIVNGRHPLQELLVPTFIANDAVLTADSSWIWVLTGANGSGKSMFLKQVAMIVYMAQVGMFVPAESARCACFDRNLPSKMPLVSHACSLEALHACDQWHSSRAFAPLTSSHCRTLRTNTEGRD
jgi:DNA mismatch repair protein MSH5